MLRHRGEGARHGLPMPGHVGEEIWRNIAYYVSNASEWTRQTGHIVLMRMSTQRLQPSGRRCSIHLQQNSGTDCVSNKKCLRQCGGMPDLSKHITCAEIIGKPVLHSNLTLLTKLITCQKNKRVPCYRKYTCGNFDLTWCLYVYVHTYICT